MSHDTRYATIPVPVSDEVWEAVRTNKDSKNGYSQDRQFRLVKWDGPTPSVLAGVTAYTEAEIHEVLAGPNWFEPYDPGPPPPEDP